MSDKEILRRYYKAKIRGIDPENYTVDALISDGSVDRYGTIFEPTAWKKDIRHYKNHPVLVASHNHYDLLGQIGEALKITFTEDGPVVKFKYYVGEGNEQADWGWKLAEKGMAMYSIGAIVHEWEDVSSEDQEKARKKDPTQAAWRRYTRVELAEVSQVVVGANRNALQRMVDVHNQEGWLKLNPGETMDHSDIGDVVNLAVEILATLKEIPEQEEMVAMSDEELERPYPNFHSCRLKDPGDFQKGKYVTQKRKSDGKEYSVILGRLKGEKTLTEQSYRYHRNTWTEKEARAHCKDHKGILFEPATGEEGKLQSDQIMEERKVIPFKKEGTAPEGRTWDAEAAIKRITIWAGGSENTTVNTEKFQGGFALMVFGEHVILGGAETIHHDIIEGALVTVWKGCVSALIWLFLEAKDLSEAERKGIYDHIAGHYRENFDREPPEFKLFTNEEIADLFGLDEDGEDGSRETPPEPVSESVYKEVLTDGPGEREGDDSGLESVIEKVEKVKATLRGDKGLEDLQALVRQITRKEKSND